MRAAGSRSAPGPLQERSSRFSLLGAASVGLFVAPLALLTLWLVARKAGGRRAALRSPVRRRSSRARGRHRRARSGRSRRPALAGRRARSGRRRHRRVHGRAPARAASVSSRLASRRGDVQRRLPRLQGLAHRCPGAPRAAGGGRTRGGAGATDVAVSEHVLRHTRGGAEVPPGGPPRRAASRARLRDRVRGEPRGRRLRRPPGERAGRRAPERAHRRVRGRRCRPRSAASRPTSASTASGRS